MAKIKTPAQPRDNHTVRQAILDYGKKHPRFTTADVAALWGLRPKDIVYGKMTVTHLFNYMDSRYGEIQRVKDETQPDGYAKRDGATVWELTEIGRKGGNWGKRWNFVRAHQPAPRAPRTKQVEATVPAETSAETIAPVFITHEKFDEFMVRVDILMDLMADKDRTIQTLEQYQKDAAERLAQLEATLKELRQKEGRTSKVVTGLQEELDKANKEIERWKAKYADKEHRIIHEVQDQAISGLMQNDRYKNLQAFLKATDKGLEARGKTKELSKV